jgi:hypothetical protein
VAGQYLADAAAVCLEEQGHGLQVTLQVAGEFRGDYVLHRHEIDDRVRSTYDPEEATEFGACGIAILLMRDQLGLTVQRAFRGEGFDYWLGTVDENLPFQIMARLEVSGIRRGSSGRIAARLRQKREQVRSSPEALLAYIMVVEFGTPMVRVARV